MLPRKPDEASVHAEDLETEVARLRQAWQDLAKGNVFGYDSAEDFARAVLAGER